MRSALLFLLVLIVSVSGVDAQQNPFRLKHKQGKVKAKDTPSNLNPFRLTWKKGDVKNIESVSQNNNNPFAIREKTYPVVSSDNGFNTTDTENTKYGGTKQLTLAVGLMLFFTLLFLFLKKSIKDAFSIFKNHKVAQQLFRGKSSVFSIGNLGWNIFFQLVLSLTIAKSLEVFNFLVFDFQNWLLILLGIMLFFVLKHLLIRMSDELFGLNDRLSFYSFTIGNFNKIFSVILFPVLLVLFFVDAEWVRFLVLSTIAVGVLFLIYRTFRMLFVNLSFILTHKFHFIIYLCVIELSPIIILVKVLS